MNNNLLLKTAVRWGSINGILTGISILAGFLYNGNSTEIPTGTAMFFLGLFGLSTFLLTFYFLYKAIQEYEYIIRKKANALDAWKIAVLSAMGRRPPRSANYF